eukprot:g36143.t1
MRVQARGQPGRAEGMEAGAVACSSCKMWEVGVTTSVLADFTSEKCTQLQLLIDSVRELELELDELWIIQEAQGVTDRSARVRDVSDQVYRILRGEDEQPEVVVSISTNDIARKRDEDLKNEYM